MNVLYPIRDEEGTIMVLALLILAMLTLIGISGTNISRTELVIAENYQLNKISFMAADSAMPYVAENKHLYDSSNIDRGQPKDFPNNDGYDNDNDGAVDEDGERFLVTDGELTYQAFNGEVEYMNAGQLPRNWGYEVGTFRAHSYRIVSQGYGPKGSERRLEEGFFRVGF